MSTSEAHLSIGEVLTELRDDYPDITISKIRFLESQGLIAPERTPSGYRKFFPADIARLRWILRQQKDNFLPLKVIRERLAEAGGEVPAGNGDQPSGTAGAAGTTGSTETAGQVTADGTGTQDAHGEVTPDDEAAGGSTADPEPEGASRARPKASKAGKASKGGRSRRARQVPAPDALTLPLEEPDGPEGEAVEPVVGAAPVTGASFTREELARAAGIDDVALAELESYGLVMPASEGERVLFDEEALVVARTAGAFARHGIEARHLKMYKNFATREAGMFEQVLLPHLRQRNPDARARAQEQLEELAGLGRTMRAAMLRSSVRRTLGP